MNATPPRAYVRFWTRHALSIALTMLLLAILMFAMGKPTSCIFFCLSGLLTATQIGRSQP
jgi:hypothetical protein